MRMPSSERVVEVTDSERRLLLRLLEWEWMRFDRNEKSEGDLSYMRDIEAVQEKLR